MPTESIENQLLWVSVSRHLAIEDVLVVGIHSTVPQNEKPEVLERISRALLRREELLDLAQEFPSETRILQALNLILALGLPYKNHREDHGHLVFWDDRHGYTVNIEIRFMA